MNKTPLLTLQQNFTSHLINKKDSTITQSLPYSNQESLARLNIYRNNIIGNFESVLSSVFEVTKKIVGEKYFTKLTHEYIKNHPSESGNLDFYGNNFPKLIKKKLKEHKLLYLEDVAKLELLYHQSYFAEDVKKIFDIEKFKKLSPKKYEDLSFQIHPSCFLFFSKFPVFSIWKNNIENRKKKIKITNNAEFAMVDRIGNSSLITKLSEEEFLFLSLTKAEKKLYETYQKICRKTKKKIDIGNFLNRFISNGVFVNFKITK